MEDNKMSPVTEEVATPEKEYTKKQIQAFQQDQKRIIYRRRRLSVVFAVAIVFFVVSGFNFIKSSQHIAQLEAEKAAVVVEQVAVTEKIADLEYEVDLLGDQEYLQKLARHKYYYSKEGELVFSIPQLNTSLNNNSETSNSSEEADSKN